MRSVYFIMLLLLGSFLSGCSDGTDKVSDDLYAELSSKVDLHCSMMTNGEAKLRVDADKIMGEILELSDVSKRQELLDRWRNQVLAFDYSSMSRAECGSRRERSYRCMQELFRDVFPRAAVSEREKWGLRLQFLGWWRKEVSKWSVKRPYPKGVFATSQNHLAKERGYNNSLIEYRNWLEEYNCSSRCYEWELVDVESRFLNARSGMVAEDSEQIAADFERYLGRKLRSEKECETDFYAKRRVEFPRYVPTPEGLKDEWREAHW